MDQVVESHRIAQGYLSSDPNRTVRVRLKDDKAYLTIKGKSNESGTARFEWEKEIDPDEAKELLALCEPIEIHKTRYIIPESHGLFFEVDVFAGVHEGLTLCEIELPSEESSFDNPSWLGKEVTGDVRYYNSYLSKNVLKNK